MSEVLRLIRELEELGQNPKESIRLAMEQTGKKAVGCFPIYAPEEIVYAGGLLPVGMWGGATVGTLADRYLQTFCCSIMKANTEQGLLGQYDFLSAVIIPAYCDTLKCMIENWKAALSHLNIIPMVYPQNRKTSAGKEYLKDEFRRIKNEIEKVAGKEITEDALKDSLDLYDDYRKTMLEFVELVQYYPVSLNAKTRHLIIKAAYFTDKKQYAEKIKRLIKAMKEQPKEESFRKKIIVTGLIAEPEGILDILTENEMFIIADDLAHETRQFRTIAPETGTAFDRMAERIALQDGCAFLYDGEKSRGKRLVELVKKHNADAVIFCQLKFCDPEEMDFPIIKKELEKENIPMLYLEIEQQMDSLEQLRTRIQGFREMLT